MKLIFITQIVIILCVQNSLAENLAEKYSLTPKIELAIKEQCIEFVAHLLCHKFFERYQHLYDASVGSCKSSIIQNTNCAQNLFEDLTRRELDVVQLKCRSLMQQTRDQNYLGELRSRVRLCIPESKAEYQRNGQLKLEYPIPDDYNQERFRNNFKAAITKACECKKNTTQDPTEKENCLRESEECENKFRLNQELVIKHCIAGSDWEKCIELPFEAEQLQTLITTFFERQYNYNQKYIKIVKFD